MDMELLHGNVNLAIDILAVIDKVKCTLQHKMKFNILPIEKKFGDRQSPVLPPDKEDTRQEDEETYTIAKALLCEITLIGYDQVRKLF